MSSYLHVWADFYSVPEVVYTTYNMGTWDLPDIYTRALGPAALWLGHIYQANPLWPCYNYYTHTYICLYSCICNSYNMGTRDLTDMYAETWGPQVQGHGYIYQENPKCPFYKWYSYSYHIGCSKNNLPKPENNRLAVI